MKTLEELNSIKGEIKTLNKKLSELNEEELKQVAGGSNHTYCEFRYDYRIQECPFSASYQEAMKKIYECHNCGKRILTD